MDNHALSHFGRYEILAELGRGAMGIVYKARDPKIDRLVAIKTISVLGEAEEDEREFRERFFLEARAAGRLSHPGIVTIFDVGEDPQTRAPYIIMEYVSGETLQKMLARTRKLSLSTSMRLAQQLAEALDYAHSQGVVHRDMKPANIIVTDEGQAKIADFGIAKLNLAHLTVTGQALGTPAYMAPEQLEGEAVDGRADLFSVGVILYAMLTGHRPFQGNSAATVSFKVVNRNPVPASAFDAKLPPEVDYVIGRAMAKDPAQRYQTGREMALDLKELLRGRGPRSIGDPLMPPGGPMTSLEAIHQATSARLAQTGLTRTKPRPPSRFLPALRITGQFFGPLSTRLLLALLAGALTTSIFFISRRRPETLTVTAVAPRPAANQVASTSTAQAPLPAVSSTENSRSSALSKAPVSRKGAIHPHQNLRPATQQPNLKVADATLQIQVEHHLQAATVSVWLDNELAYTQSLQNRKKHLVIFGSHSGIDQASVKVPSGKHLVGVRVESTDGYSESASLDGEFQKSAAKTLHVICGKKLSLSWQ